MRLPAALPSDPADDSARREPSLSRSAGARLVAPDRAPGSARATILRAANPASGAGPELRAGERIAILSEGAPAERGFGRGVLAKLAIVVVVLLALVGVASLRSFVGL